jgi:hypothetical protein
MILHKKHKIGFTQIDNKLLNDARLTWKAKGVLCYLLSKPEGWQVNVWDIIKHGADGEAALRAAMRELREHHYAQLQNMRADGRIVQRCLTIDEHGKLPTDDLLGSDIENLNQENLNEENREAYQYGDYSKTEKKSSSAVTAKVGWSPAQGWSSIDDDLRSELRQAYPACDVERQLRQMTMWLKANPARAKKSNYLRFINNWLKKEQDRGGDQRGKHSTPATPINVRNKRINKLNEQKAYWMRQPESARRSRELEQIRVELQTL